MDEKIEQCLSWLTKNNVSYTLFEHEAAFTIEEIDAMGINQYGNICKNLFLRDFKGKRHFLVCIRQDKRTDLQKLGELLGARLSFASEQRLEKHLNLTKGSVTPLGLKNDTEAQVEVVFDQDLDTAIPVGVHPCLNTATVFVQFEDLKRLTEQNKNKLIITKL